MASIAASDHRAPGLPRLLREAGSLLALRTRSVLALTGTMPSVGRGRPVMVIPGFLASDFSTLILRRTLEGAGYRVHGPRSPSGRGPTASLRPPAPAASRTNATAASSSTAPIWAS